DLSLLDGWVRSANLPVKGDLAAPTA
ncbi:MAG: hypothetical protein QG622_3211, partial [Actinomycetota bacterium]|nr:hypothetical protein [Actinomycetota bacterium]